MKKLYKYIKSWIRFQLMLWKKHKTFLEYSERYMDMERDKRALRDS